MQAALHPILPCVVFLSSYTLVFGALGACKSPAAATGRKPVAPTNQPRGRTTARPAQNKSAHWDQDTRPRTEPLTVSQKLDVLVHLRVPPAKSVYFKSFIRHPAVVKATQSAFYKTMKAQCGTDLFRVMEALRFGAVKNERGSFKDRFFVLANGRKLWARKLIACLQSHRPQDKRTYGSATISGKPALVISKAGKQNNYLIAVNTHTIAYAAASVSTLAAQGYGASVADEILSVKTRVSKPFRNRPLVAWGVFSRALIPQQRHGMLARLNTIEGVGFGVAQKNKNWHLQIDVKTESSAAAQSLSGLIKMMKMLLARKAAKSPKPLFRTLGKALRSLATHRDDRHILLNLTVSDGDVQNLFKHYMPKPKNVSTTTP
jgi:hypothetical protein